MFTVCSSQAIGLTAQNRLQFDVLHVSPAQSACQLNLVDLRLTLL